MRTSHFVKLHVPQIFESMGSKSTESFPLIYANPGEKVRVVSLAGGRNMCQRLIAMGLNIDSEIRVIRKGSPGPSVIAVGDARLAIGAGMALKIMVSPIP